MAATTTSSSSEAAPPGCALANRLSADPSTRVLVLEAGRGDWSLDPFIHMPAALAFPIGNRFYDWRYESEPEPHMNGRRIFHARGKVLGGSSSINGMIFQRGNPLDFERWAAEPGLAAWDHAHCLPYFKRMENCLAAAPDDPFRGHDGPLVLERGPARGPLFDAFFAAVQEAGYPLTEDVNGYRQEGFAAFDRNVHSGRRLSAARAYLHPVMGRPNLDVVTRAQVTRVVFEGTRAAGVEVRGRRPRHRRSPPAEVILCGGAINSPQLLQLSGVGAAGDLRALGVDVVADLPGVGENLQDHLEVYVQHSSTQPVTMAPYFRMRNRPRVGLEWFLRKTGPGASNHFEAGGFVRSNDDVAYPNLMFHFLPIAVRYDGTLPEGGGGHGYQVHVGPMYSDARGTFKLTSADPRRIPALRFNYLSTDQDRREWVEAVRVRARDPGRAGAAGVQRRGALARPGRRATSRSSTGSRATPRPRCTRRARRVGTGEDAVTTPLAARARGHGLRVVDASVFPFVTNGNIYAPTMMTAEKAADLILGNTPPAARARAVLPARARGGGGRRTPLAPMRDARARGRRGRRRAATMLDDALPDPGALQWTSLRPSGAAYGDRS